ncbi:MAG TPA: TIGR00730 family Rossman fold protein [Polyangia bacterium]|jgi:hypothetical protein
MDQGRPRPLLAYENREFLNSHAGRGLRILAEYQEPLARFRREGIQDTVVFFGSARCCIRATAEQALAALDRPEAATAPDYEDALRQAREALRMADYYDDARRLAFMVTRWARSIPSRRHRFVVTTGGGPGIMEAANRGAHEAGGKTIGLNVSLPREQRSNPFITPALNFQFHYFFMRKLWFAYLAKALIVFPGGFGTCDELFEILTLAQTEKLAKRIIVVMYGREYWDRVVDFGAMVDAGVIGAADLALFQMASTPEEAFELLRAGLVQHHLGPTRRKAPEIAKTRP